MSSWSSRFPSAPLLAFVAAIAACSSSSESSSNKGTTSDAGHSSVNDASDASTDYAKTFAVESSYATFSYEVCEGEADAGNFMNFGNVDAGTCMGEQLAVFLTNNAKLTCSATAGGANNLDTPHTSSLGLIFSTSGDTNVLVPGTYTLGSTLNASILAQAIFTTTDSTCNRNGPNVTGGSLTITAITTSSASGSYDVKFDNGDTLKGSFSVNECPTATGPSALGAEADAGACTGL